MTHLHIPVPAITRGTLARTHELIKDFRKSIRKSMDVEMSVYGKIDFIRRHGSISLLNSCFQFCHATFLCGEERCVTTLKNGSVADYGSIRFFHYHITYRVYVFSFI